MLSLRPINSSTFGQGGYIPEALACCIIQQFMGGIENDDQIWRELSGHSSDVGSNTCRFYQLKNRPQVIKFKL